MIAIDVQDVSKRFRLYTERPGSLKELFTRFGRPTYEEFWAVRDVSLTVEEGTVHGLIGHNGCGKSSLLRMIAGIHTPTSGKVVTAGRISALLELGAGFHPELTGRENIYLNASILGMNRKQTDARLDRIVEFSGLSEFIDSPVKHYSSGMFVRLGFSVAVHVEPRILLVDEVIAVGDEEFQRRCLDHLRDLRAQGVTIVMVTHSMGVVQSMCDTATWMDHGRVVRTGPPSEVVSDYLSGGNAREAERERLDGSRTPVVVSKGSDSRELRIDAFVPQTFDGTAVPFAVSGHPLCLRIDWSTVGAFPHPHFVLHVETPSELHLATSFSPELPQDLMEEGSWSAECRFETFPFAPGDYVLRVTAIDQRTAAVLAPSDDIVLPVRPSGTIVEGLFALPATWHSGFRRH
ncbi:MAG: polysaccharide ABC transporter ATP-binding protein [Acidimicrobiia bacterium]